MRWGCLLVLVPVLAQAQVRLGRLYYATRSGRAVTLQVVEAGPGRLTLAPETGDAAALRAAVLAHAGSEARVAAGARALADPVPGAWKGGGPGSDLVRNAEATFWRHAPGQVVPAKFRALDQTWQLLAAELPANRRFGP